MTLRYRRNEFISNFGQIGRLTNILTEHGAVPDQTKSKILIFYDDEAASPFKMVLEGFKGLQSKEKKDVTKRLISSSNEEARSGPGAPRLVMRGFGQLSPQKNEKALHLSVDMM